MKVEIGDTIKIIMMFKEPEYNDKIGVIEFIDDIGQIHGSWGGCAIAPEVDEFEIILKKNENNLR